MPERTPAQKAATRRMIAANRARLRGRGGRRGAAGYARGYPVERVHHRAKQHRVSLTEEGGEVLAGWGVFFQNAPGRQTPYGAARSGQISNAVFNATQAIPVYGTDPSNAPARATVATGMLALAAGRFVEWLGIKSPKVHMGRLTLKLWGK